MKNTFDLEFDLAIAKLTETLFQNGITASHINTLRVKTVPLFESNISHNKLYNEITGWFKKLIEADAADPMNLRPAPAPGAAPAPAPGAAPAHNIAEIMGLRKTLEEALKAYFLKLRGLGASKETANKEYSLMLSKINSFTNQLVAHRSKNAVNPGATDANPQGFHKPIETNKLNSLQAAVYGSGDGRDGDFSNFDNPPLAKSYFMRNFSGKPANPQAFAAFLRQYGHKEVANEGFNYFYNKMLAERNRS